VLSLACVCVHVYLFECKRHGGTPNLSAEARAIPCAGFTAPWFRPPTSSTQVTGRRFMGAMSAAGRHACRDMALGEARVRRRRFKRGGRAGIARQVWAVAASMR
jgi:hypothetical protein